MFLKLIGISGIGPKLAMNILSGIAPGDLEEAIRSSDLARISLVPGIGKKTALRITMELQDKLEKKEKLLAAKASPEKEDLLSALLNMGFRQQGGRAGRRPDDRRQQAGDGVREAPPGLPEAPGQDLKRGRPSPRGPDPLSLRSFGAGSLASWTLPAPFNVLTGLDNSLTTSLAGPVIVSASRGALTRVRKRR